MVFECTRVKPGKPTRSRVGFPRLSGNIFAYGYILREASPNEYTLSPEYIAPQNITCTFLVGNEVVYIWNNFLYIFFNKRNNSQSTPVFLQQFQAITFVDTLSVSTQGKIKNCLIVDSKLNYI